MANNMIYHYTSIDSFVGMIENSRRSNDKKNLVFWASSIFAMNDPLEFQHGIELINSLANEYENEKQINDVYRLSTSFADELTLCPFFKSTDILLDRFFINPPKTPFVISFSRNEDDLAMWNLYGDKGKGVCLHFSEDIPPFTETDSIISRHLMDVDYSNDIKNNVKLYSLFEQIFNEFLISLKKKRNIGELHVHRCWSMARLYHFLCPFLKHHKYENEREVRISGLPINLDAIRYRTRNGNIIPYVEAQINISHLKGITIGPCCDFDCIKRGINHILYMIDLNKDPLSQEDLPIHRSSVPYRLL